MGSGRFRYLFLPARRWSEFLGFPCGVGPAGRRKFVSPEVYDRLSNRLSKRAGSAVFGVLKGCRSGSFKGGTDIDIDVEVDAETGSYFVCLKGVSKSHRYCFRV